MMYIQMAWRNLLRNKRRTSITVASISLAVVLITVINALQLGNMEQLTAVSARQFEGDLQVTHSEYRDDPVLTNSFAAGAVDWDALDLPNLETYAPRVSGFGLVSSDSGSAGAMIIGIDPERETAVTTFSGRVNEGEPLVATDYFEALVGHLLARTLDVQPGDTIAIISQGMYGEMAAEIYLVKGLLRTNQPEIDRRTVVLPLEAAQEFFFMPGRLTQVLFRTGDLTAADNTARSLRQTLPADANLEVAAWPELLPGMVQIIDFGRIRNAILMAFLLILVGFEIFNTTMMSVLERGREFGLLQSIGMKPLSVGTLVAVEWLMKVVAACVIGFVAAYAITLHFWHNPIPVGGTGDIFEAFGFELEYMVVAMRPEVFLMPIAVLFVISIPALLYPFVKTVRQEPLDAMRTT